MPTHVLATSGTFTETYDPAITQTAQPVETTGDTVFVPVQAAIPPFAQLLSAHYDFTFTQECTGTVTQPSGEATLCWSDGTKSKCTLTSATVERIEGHALSRLVFTITKGHFEDGTLTSLAVTLSGDPAACPTGGSVATACGACVVILTMP